MPTSHQQQTTHLKILASSSNEDCAFVDVAVIGSEITVSKQLAALLLKEYPTLAAHACKSAGGDSPVDTNTPATFGPRLIGALLPHAAEHVAIENLVQTYPGEVFTGATKWQSRNDHIMRIRVSLPQSGAPAASLDALAKAINRLNELIVQSAGAGA